MTFSEHINKEAEVIKKWIANNDDVELKKIQNEGYSRYDFSFVSGATGTHQVINGVAEVKKRNHKSDCYEGGVMIELSKYQALHEIVAKNKTKCQNLDIRPFYLCSYSDKDVIFDLSSTKMGSIKYIWSPVATASNGKKEYKFKSVFFLPLSESIK